MKKCLFKRFSLFPSPERHLVLHLGITSLAARDDHEPDPADDHAHDAEGEENEDVNGEWEGLENAADAVNHPQEGVPSSPLHPITIHCLHHSRKEIE